VRFFLALVVVMLASTAQAQSREQKPVDWRTFEIPDFGTRIQYPAGIFSPAGKPEKGVGQRFERADGRAVLSIYSRPNEAGDNPATYLRDNLRVSRSTLDYTRITRFEHLGRRAAMPFTIFPHMLRHGCGYGLANAGHDTRAHKNIQHTVRYTELAPDRFKDFWR
jgi:integrase